MRLTHIPAEGPDDVFFRAHEGARDVAMRKDRHDGASYRRLELITGSKRRRARSAREKAAILAETFAPEPTFQRSHDGTALTAACCSPGVGK